MVDITSPGIRFNSPSNFFKIGTYADDENGFITASGVTMRLIAVNAGNQQVNNTPTQTWVG